MYILVDEPKRSGSDLAGAFDAIDQVYGTAPFSGEQAVTAIVTVMAYSTTHARSMFNALVDGGHISEG